MLAHTRHQKDGSTNVALEEMKYESWLKNKVTALEREFIDDPAGMQSWQRERLVDFLHEKLINFQLLQASGRDLDASWVAFNKTSLNGGRDDAFDKATDILWSRSKDAMSGAMGTLWNQKFGRAFGVAIGELLEAVHDAAYTDTARTPDIVQGVTYEDAQRIASEALDDTTDKLYRAPENSAEGRNGINFGRLMRENVTGRFEWDDVRSDPNWSLAVNEVVDVISDEFYTPRYGVIKIVQELGRAGILYIAESAVHDAVMIALLSEVNEGKLPEDIVFDREHKETKMVKDLVYVAKLWATYLVVTDLVAYIDTFDCGGSSQQREDIMETVKEMISKYGNLPQQREEIKDILMIFMGDGSQQEREDSIDDMIREYEGTKQERDGLKEAMKEIIRKYGDSLQCKELMEIINCSFPNNEDAEQWGEKMNRLCKIAEDNLEIIYALRKIAEDSLDAIQRGCGLLGIFNNRPYVYYVKTNEAARAYTLLKHIERTE